jgi:hypothetical protein
MNIGVVCNEINNYFVNGSSDIHCDDYTISDGVITPSDFLLVGQYFRIVGSVLNDGVYQYTGEPIDELRNESFSGSVWAMRVPKDFENLVSAISAWDSKYGSVDSANMSPYNSESYAGQYSYTKSSGPTATGGGSGITWQSQFGSQLALYRKVSVL